MHTHLRLTDEDGEPEDQPAEQENHHNDQGGPVFVRAMMSRSVRDVLTCFRASSELARNRAGWRLLR